MTKPQLRAGPPLGFIPPAFNPWVQRATCLALPFWLRTQLAIDRIETRGVDALVDLYQDLAAGRARFLLGFRHPTLDDPFCMLHLVTQAVPAAARRRGIALKAPVHSHFIYDRGIPLWAGQWVGPFFAALGGIPIQRGKADRVGLKVAREVLVNSPMPLALAPEGGINGRSEQVSPLEPGVAQLAFWGLEDLHTAGRAEAMYIVPVGLQYRFHQPPWAAIDQMLSQLEQDCGRPAGPRGPLPADPAQAFYPRLRALGEQALGLMEQFYSRFYRADLPRPADLEPADRPNQVIGQRLRALMETALTVAEQFFGLPGRGTPTERCRQLEQAGWNWMYREELKPPITLSPVERGLADRIAQEADLRLWHMHLVEKLLSITGDYVLANPSAERFAETLVLVGQVLADLKGTPKPIPPLGRRWVQMTVAPPIRVNDYWPQYQENRRAARQAILDLTQDLATHLQETITPTPRS